MKHSSYNILSPPLSEHPSILPFHTCIITLNASPSLILYATGQAHETSPPSVPFCAMWFLRSRTRSRSELLLNFADPSGTRDEYPLRTKRGSIGLLLPVA